MDSPRPDPPTVPLTLARQIDDACGRFEAAWRADTRPEIEVFLAETSPPVRDALLLELIRLDAYYRRRAGDDPAAGDYLARFPTLDPAWVNEALAETAAPPGAAGSSELTRLGDYQVLGELGRGGMGAVYRARDTGLNRDVALKMIRAGEFAGPGDLTRFRAEARAVARLQHPNVVQIFDVGEHDGRPFLVLELVEGGNLSGRLAGTPMPPSDAARLAEVLARAVQHAHERHIVHRDLKPSNVLLTPDGSPKVTDFGLAKLLDAGAGPTGTQAVMGTPSYMAPEQASGDAGRVGPAVDVYGLGAVLYECLTGRPPFLGASAADTLVQVRTREPVPVRQLVPSVPRDLETVCLKCLEKDPARRYASATDLADDLRRFLDGRPVAARPTPAWERALKWVRRHPAVATLCTVSAAAVGAVVAVLAVSNAEVRRAYGEVTAALGERDEANGRLTGTNNELAGVNAALTRSLADERAAVTARDAAIGTLTRNQYAQNIALAYGEWKVGNVSRMYSYLGACPPELRRWEWYFLSRLDQASFLTIRAFTKSEGVGGLAVSGDGKRIAGCALNVGWAVWDAETGEELFRYQPGVWGAANVALSGDGRLVAGVINRQLMAWEVATRKVVLSVPAFGQREPTPVGGGEPVAFSPDGRQLAVSAGTSTGPLLNIWDLGTKKAIEVRLPRGPGGAYAVRCPVAFSPDGKTLAVSGPGLGELSLYDTANGLVRRSEQVRIGPGPLAFSPDGQRLAVAAIVVERIDRVGVSAPIAEFDVATLTELRRYTGHTDRVTGLTYLRAGRRGVELASSSDDGTARVWDPTTGAASRVYRCGSPLAPARGESQVRGIAACNGRLVTAHTDGTVKVWADLAQEWAVLRGRSHRTVGTASHPDRRDQDLAAWDEKDAAAVRAALWPPSPRATSPDGSREVREAPPDGNPPAGAGTNEVQVRDRASQKELFRLRGHTQPVRDVAYSPVGGVIATGGDDPVVKLWQADDGRFLRDLPNPDKTRTTSLAFAPDGQALLVVGVSKSARVWDLFTGSLLRTLPHADNPVVGRFSPNGRRIVTGDAAGVVRVWDATTDGLINSFLGHRRRLRNLVFVSGGDRLVTVSEDGLKVWDTSDWRELLWVSEQSDDADLATRP